MIGPRPLGSRRHPWGDLVVLTGWRQWGHSMDFLSFCHISPKGLKGDSVSSCSQGACEEDPTHVEDIKRSPKSPIDQTLPFGLQPPTSLRKRVLLNALGLAPELLVYSLQRC
ncbi:hypothetical protein L6164_016661 [Bauhinia variegata]|uniref:Uncharacterized protein n=1 Tax=Bauhinia variegata TaxID=167791 RepID=A0ACB9NQS8_BAUVA|nr:hypothetical protein L6164_016661 [Bauhinia variegata]